MYLILLSRSEVGEVEQYPNDDVPRFLAQNVDSPVFTSTSGLTF